MSHLSSINWNDGEGSETPDHVWHQTDQKYLAMRWSYTLGQACNFLTGCKGALACKGVNFWDKGVNFLDKGVTFWDKGVNFWDKGVNFLDKGVNFWDNGVNFWDKGVNFLDKGVNFLDKGVIFWDKGVNFWDMGGVNLVNMCIKFWICVGKWVWNAAL